MGWARRAALIVAIVFAGSLASAEKPSGRVKKIVHNPPGDAPILGPRYAPVTIEFFLDLTDHTKSYRFAERLRELAERHPLRLRIIYRLFKRPRSEMAEAALEAFAQGKFHAFLKAYYGRHRRSPNRKELPSIAEEAGVDYREIEKAWKDNRHEEALDRNEWRRRRFQLTGIPSLLVNGKPIRSIGRGLEAYEAVYDDAYAEASKLLADGAQLSTLYERILATKAAEAKVPSIDVQSVDGPRLGAKLEAQQNGFDLQGKVDYDGPHSLGPRDAAVQVVLYCAIGTRYCNRMSRTLSDLRKAYADELRVVFKPVDIGLEDDRAEIVRELHIAADCAGEQDLYWEFARVVQERTRLPSARRLDVYLKDRAERAELDLTRWNDCRKVAKGAEDRAALNREAREAGVVRVPSLVIGGRLYIGNLPFNAMNSLIGVELAPGLLESWLDN